MFKFCETLLKSSKNNKLLYSFIRFNNYSSSTVELRKIQNLSSDSSEVHEDKIIRKTNGITQQSKQFNTNGNIVAAAFASLKLDNASNNVDIETPATDHRIGKATTIDELLSISEGIGISRRHALQVVSVLADWSAMDKIKLSDFESDPRFLKLCKVLTRTTHTIKKDRNKSRSEDLNTILNVTADDEAAKLVATITLPQMVKVMSALASKKRRSISLLRSLAFNITRNSDKLNIKQSGDLLYSMAVLHFPDENLLHRISTDVCEVLDDNMNKSAVIGSILTSLGLLKYKEPNILEALSNWILKHHDISRPQDICALILTLGMLNYEPNNAKELYEVTIPQLAMSDISKTNTWLDIIWSLVILNRASTEQITSVLNDDFVKNFEDTLRISAKLKLLNINGASKYLIQNYDGPQLNTSFIQSLNLTRSKEKEDIVKSIVDCLKNLVQSANLRVNVDSGMGFFIDAECFVDKKCNPIPFDKSASTNDAKKIAFIAYDYHDLCIGKSEPTGINVLAAKLLEAQGYNLLTVPYHEFKSSDKLIIRVQYLESKLKALIKT